MFFFKLKTRKLGDSFVKINFEKLYYCLENSIHDDDACAR